MTISSINFQRVRGDKKQALDHIARTTEKEPVYLLDKDARKPNGFELLQDVDKLHEAQMQLRKQNHSRGKAPELNDSLWEAVINLEEHHTMDDVKKVADFIHKKYHLTPTAIAIHRDEGYTDKSTGETKYNYHAHVMFYTVEHGKSQMRTIGKKALSEMQTEVAQLLNMQRGQVNSKTVRLNHRQYREQAQKLAQKEHINQIFAQQIADRHQDILTLKEQKAIVEAERKKYKEEADHIASEYRKLQALNKTLHTQEELNQALAALRKDYEDRLAKARANDVEKITELNRTVKELQDTNEQLNTELEKVTKERDGFVIITQTVYQFIQSIFPEFDVHKPKQSMINIYTKWKSEHQKSSVTLQKSSQNNKNTVQRTETQQNSQSQSISKFDTSQPKEKRYSIIISRQPYDLTAKDIHEWLSEYPEEKESIAKQLSEADRREVFGEPTQAQTPQKQSFFTRVRHGFER